MAITVTLPAVLARHAGGVREHAAEGSTLGDVIGLLASRFPELAPRIRDEAGQPYPFVVYYLNDEDVRLNGGFATTVRDGDEVTLVPAIAGG